MSTDSTPAPQVEIQLPELLADLHEYMQARADADHDGVSYVANDEMRLQQRIEQVQAALNARAGGGVFSGLYPPHPSTQDNTGWTTGIVLYIDNPTDGGPETRQGAFDHVRRTFIDSTTASPIEPDYWQSRPRFHSGKQQPAPDALASQAVGVKS